MNAKKVVDIDGVEFVKLSASDGSLVRLVSEGFVESFPRNPSLAQCTGVKELMKLRNDKQIADLADTTQPKTGLFGDVQPPAQKRQRRSASDARDMRSNPSVLTVTADGKEVAMVRPVHARDDLCEV